MALDYDGTYLIKVTEEIVFDSFPVYWVDGGGNTLGAAIGCAGDPNSALWVNVNASTTQLVNVGRHEMLHKAGAAHAGIADSYGGDNPPTMKTCTSTPTTVATLDQDGQANANWLYSSLANRQLQANVGFEQGFGSELPRFWGKQGNADVFEHTTGGAGGAAHVGWRADNNATKWLYQTVRVLNGNDDLTYRAVLNAKRPSQEFATWVNVALFRRNLSLDPDPGGGTCPAGTWPDGIAWANSPGSPTAWKKMTESGLTHVPSTDWFLVGTQGPEWADPPQADAYDFQVRAYGTAFDGSSYGRVRFDNVRGEGSGEN